MKGAQQIKQKRKISIPEKSRRIITAFPAAAKTFLGRQVTG
jgi:hypothetical protein